ncbi:nucleotide sugar dehydrogenase [Polyangium sp. y55x31]|uniref:nucleotide sugar dehydrogenase n=1 Tax=Polyangium sp. y55x31 TaxID=3042688 RepID=UPI002482BFCB|nr:nucleotide sugar dehydrogenase [Polyangium sp. y55x31]MDI1483703.1 nucleotide sugar dehydrogenase [Polyangium sp. y55x31]
MQELLKKIEDRSAHIVVVGIGYVGLPLVVEFARAGFSVTGYDKDREKVRLLGQGESYIGDIPSSALAPHVAAGRLRATTDPDVLGSADAIVVCVPTPLNKTKDPDMRFILSASDEIAEHQHPNMLIVLESTTYPGTTREVLVPKLTAGRYELGKDVFIAFSPERVDPGNKTYGTRNTPKVLGGATPGCLEVAMALYGKIIETVVPVSSTDAAEMVKLLENTFRAVNIGLVNEVALMSRKLGIDVWEVIRAAATKPFGFMPFFPGPGLGGHCIPIDPLYLSWRMRTLKYQARFIELADTINSAMPEYVVHLVQQALNGERKAANGSKILVSGVAYKRDVADYRESPAFDIIHQLQGLGAEVRYHDPYVPECDEGGIVMRSEPSTVAYGEYDAVVIVTDHASVDYARMLREAKLVVDTRDALRKVEGDKGKVVRL